MEAKELLIADLEHFGESAWRNEEIGEKRFSFFVTLVTAVSAGLVALATTDEPLPDQTFKDIVTTAIAALLVIGLLTYIRMIHRNRVTDEYHNTLAYIRKTYISLCADLKSYRVPVRRKSWWGKWLRGGYAETIGIIDGMLLSALLLLSGWTGRAEAILGGVLLVVALWILAGPRIKEGQ